MRIRVYVVARKGRDLVLRAFIDRGGGRLRPYQPPGGASEKSARTLRKREAYQLAREWERELNKATAAASFGDACDRYMTERLSLLSESSRQVFHAAKVALERAVQPDSVSAITASALSRLAGKLKAQGLATDTIRTYLIRIGGFLGWAHEVELIDTIPTVTLPKARRGKLWKGRPIVATEFERLLAATPAVTGDKDAQAWHHLMHVLWLSSLRLGEALNITWNPRQGSHHISQLDSASPKIAISGTSEKGRKDRMIVCAPDFAEYLRGVPPGRRVGRVVGRLTRRGVAIHNQRSIAGVLSEISQAAGVVVSEPEAEKVKYASAHDYRRAFATRWAPHIHPRVLQETMRHAASSTTERYYLDIRVDDCGRDFTAAWKAICETPSCDIPCDMPAKGKRRTRKA